MLVGRKRGRAGGVGSKDADLDLEISSVDSSSGEEEGGREGGDGENGDFGALRQETAEERRMRLAREYLRTVEEAEGHRTAEVGRRLEEEAKSHAGSGALRPASAKLEALPPSWWSEAGRVAFRRGHKHVVTCVCVRGDGKVAWSGGKDGFVLEWDLEGGGKRVFGAGDDEEVDIVPRGRAIARAASEGWGVGTGVSLVAKALTGRLPTFRSRHLGAVLSIACSEDGRWVVSGGEDRLVRIWDPSLQRCVHVLKGHGGPVTGVGMRWGVGGSEDAEGDRGIVVRKDKRTTTTTTTTSTTTTSTTPSSSSSFSSSHDDVYSVGGDGCLCLWHATTGAFVEKLFGTSASIGMEGIDVRRRERCVTVGGRERTVRLWNIATEKQLLFYGPKQCHSLDCVALISNHLFATGAQDGSITLFSTDRKAPIANVTQAHGPANEKSTLQKAQDKRKNRIVTFQEEEESHDDKEESEEEEEESEEEEEESEEEEEESEEEEEESEDEEEEEESEEDEEESEEDEDDEEDDEEDDDDDEDEEEEDDDDVAADPSPSPPSSPPSSSLGMPITSLGHLEGTDLLVSGSGDGWVRFWAVGNPTGRRDQRLREVGKVRVFGFVNGMRFTPDGTTLLCAVGREPRRGRWMVRKCRHGIVKINLPKNLRERAKSTPRGEDGEEDEM